MIPGTPTSAPERLRIVEQFNSLQGEGALVGVPSRFVRVSGCNLRCHWCDTPESSWRPTGSSIDVGTLIRDCEQGPRHVVLTGGEPLLFAPVVTLARELRARGHHVTIETAGTRWLEGLEWDLLSLSPKLAHSTPQGSPLAKRHEAQRWPTATLQRFLQQGRWQLKFVVRTQTQTELQADLDEIERALQELGVTTAEARSRVYVMPECTQPERIGQAYLALSGPCLRRGFALGQRLQIQLWGHTPGT